MSHIKENLDFIKDNIANISKNSGRDNSDIIILGVTKTVDIESIEEAISLGITDIAENKPQELARKYEIIGNKVKWHLIGSLQTNKVKYIIDKVDMIHSLDREGLCEEIQKRAEKINKEINCLVQVNVSKEESKHGLDKDDVEEFIKNVATNYKNIKIKGLMTMAPFTDDKDLIRSIFKSLKELSTKIDNTNIENVSMDYLSMGMSSDYDIAIQEGANIVRIGTSIFGKRDYNQ